MLGPDVPRILLGTSGMASQTRSWFTPTNPAGPSQPSSLQGAVPARLPGLSWRGGSSLPLMKFLAELGFRFLLSFFLLEILLRKHGFRETEPRVVCEDFAVEDFSSSAE